MTLTDTGPLVAIINRNDPNHGKCVIATKSLPAQPLVTTWPCLTEAMYLLFQAGGHTAQAALWRLRKDGKLILLDLTSEEADRAAVLMDKYHDRPMDLADASIVAAAERLGTRQVFTLDNDFRIYRLADGSALELVP